MYSTENITVYRIVIDENTKQAIVEQINEDGVQRKDAKFVTHKLLDSLGR